MFCKLSGFPAAWINEVYLAIVASVCEKGYPSRIGGPSGGRTTSILCVCQLKGSLPLAHKPYFRFILIFIPVCMDLTV